MVVPCWYNMNYDQCHTGVPSSAAYGLPWVLQAVVESALIVLVPLSLIFLGRWLWNKKHHDIPQKESTK